MKQRLLNTKIWSDSWFRQKLNPLDRYLFIYFLTNEHTSICGIYELPLESIAFETGLDTHDLVKSLLPRLRPKIMYKNNWVVIPNFIRHQNWNSPKVKTGIMAEISQIPKEIVDLAIGYGYPIDTISHSNSNSNLNSNSNTNTKLSSKEDKAKPVYGNPLINKFLTYLKEKTEVIDTPVKFQRTDSWILIRKMKSIGKEKVGREPTDDEVMNGLKFLVDTACSDKFHSQRAGNIKYLYNNIGAITKSKQTKKWAII